MALSHSPNKPAYRRPLPARDALLAAGFLLVIIVVPLATIFASLPGQKPPAPPSGSSINRTQELFAPDYHEPLSFEDFAGGETQPLPTRAAWKRKIGRVLFGLSQFPDQFKETFVFRAPLVRAYGFLKSHGLASTRSTQALFGKNDWIFYSGENAVTQFCRTQPASEDELEKLQVLLQRKNDWLAQRGIHLLIVIAPDKHTIYPEFMPSYLQPRKTPSRLDQLMARLSSSHLDVLDLRPVLMKNKNFLPGHTLYYRTDTHWNPLGAFVASQATAARLQHTFPRVKPMPPESYRLHFSLGAGGDLARLLGMQAGLRDERVEFRPRNGKTFPVQKSAFVRDTMGRFGQKIETRDKCAPPLRAFIFGDSFTCETPYLSFLSQHFAHMTVWRNSAEPRMDRVAIEKMRPQIVVWQIVERKLTALSSPTEKAAGLALK